MNDKAEFLPKDYSGLKEIQQAFDHYQKEAFPARGGNFFALELNGEAGELANLEKKIWKGLPVEQESLEDEAADVYIALMNYANARKIDLAKAVQAKMEIIETKRSNRL